MPEDCVIQTTTIEKINETMCSHENNHWEIDLSAKVNEIHLAIRNGEGIIEFASDGEVCVVPLICEHCKMTANVKLQEDGSEGFAPLYHREFGEALA